MNREITPLIAVTKMNFSEDDENIYAKGSCLTKLNGSGKPFDTSKVTLDTPNIKNVGRLEFGDRYGKRLVKGYCLNSFTITINKKEAYEFDIQNKLVVRYEDKYAGRILYNFFDMKTGKNNNSPIFIHNGMAMYFRQNKYNTMWFVVRDANIYDYPEGQERLKRAYKNAKKLANQDIILMYEKNCMRYEESASVLYEQLIDAGYDNVYYVVNFDNPAIQNLQEKYRRNLIDKDSDRHLEYFFASKKFISSESPDHALQLRAANKYVQDKYASRDLQYVFLQHGVMYMVSLNSDLRVGFKQSDRKLHRTVVSSEAEAQHFVDLAGMKRDDLYITGLAKFDKCYRNDDADRIIIMLTWRRWETNQARTCLEETKYYKMIERIYNAVPDELKSKVVILPHPLMAERFRGEKGLGEHILTDVSYDEVFRGCDLLITDYSSIAYDAFYRGANVIFCWEEKDECMEHYGEGSYLMLNNDNVFGDVCMDAKEVGAAIKKNYGTPQSEENIKKYRHIVEFHDGKNSERIMKCLIKDGLIGERKDS